MMQFMMLLMGLLAVFPARAAEKAAAAEPPRKVAGMVVVFDFAGLEVSRESALIVTDLFLGELAKAPGIQAVGRKEIDALIDNTAERQKCGSEVSCMAEVAGALGAAYLVSGSIGKLGKYILSVSIMDQKSARVVARANRDFGRLEDIPAGMASVVKALLTGEVEAAGKKALPLHIAVDRDGAEVILDGVPAGKCPLKSPLMVEKGEHLLVVRLAGFEPHAEMLNIEGEKRVAVILAQVKPLGAEGGPNLTAWAWVSGGVGVAAAVSGGIFGLMANSGKENYDGATYKGLASHYREQTENRALAANLSFAVAGSAAVAATVLYFIGKDDAPQKEGRKP